MLSLTAEIVSAYAAKNSLPTAALPELIGQIHQSLTGLSSSRKVEAPIALVQAVPIEKISCSPGYLISLEDRRKFRSMKRYLGPAQHRARPNTARNRNLPKTFSDGRAQLRGATIKIGQEAGPRPPARRCRWPRTEEQRRHRRCAEQLARSAAGTSGRPIQGSMTHLPSSWRWRAGGSSALATPQPVVRPSAVAAFATAFY